MKNQIDKKICVPFSGYHCSPQIEENGSSDLRKAIGTTAPRSDRDRPQIAAVAHAMPTDLSRPECRMSLAPSPCLFSQVLCLAVSAWRVFLKLSRPHKEKVIAYQDAPL